MEVAETLTKQDLDRQQKFQQEVTYSIVKHEDRWAIFIESGIFEKFTFVILNMRLRYEDENEAGETETKLVEDINEVLDKELALDFEYDLVSVPSEYIDEKGNQQYFEEVARNILMDILVNYPNLYKLDKESDE
jgi:hypothetical protein